MSLLATEYVYELEYDFIVIHRIMTSFQLHSIPCSRAHHVIDLNRMQGLIHTIDSDVKQPVSKTANLNRE